jgi:hypothetical protein
MIDKATGQVEPCPMCGSREVRWRQRRWYDVLRTWLRWLVEAVLSAFGGGRKSSYSPVIGDPQGYSYEAQVAAFDHRWSIQTPRSFWRCSDCRRRGYVFDPLDGSEHRNVLEREDAIRAQGGSVSHPSGGRPPGRD